jgi:hypothetical protein
VVLHAILIPLRRKCSRNYSDYVGNNVSYITKKYFGNTWILLIFQWHSTQDGECNQTGVLRGGVAKYCCATIYHGHLIVPTNNHTDILSQPQFITATLAQPQISVFGHSTELSTGITQTEGDINILFIQSSL